MNNKHIFKIHFLILVIFFIISLIAIRKFLNFEITIGHNWDSPFSALKLNYKSILDGIFYVWDDYYSLGGSVLSGLSPKIWWISNALIGIVLKGVFVSQLKIISAMTLGGFFMYYYLFSLISSQYSDKKNITLSSFCAGLIFMLSPVVLGHIIGGAFSQLDTMIAIPLLLIILHKGIDVNRPNIIVVLISLVLLWLAASIHNFLFGILFVFFYVLFFYKLAIKDKIIFYAKTFFLSTLLNIFWMIPLAYGALFENIGKRFQENLNFDNLIYNTPSLSDSFFINGYIRQFYNLLVNPELYIFWKVAAFVFLFFIFAAVIFPDRQKEKLIKKYGLFWLSVFLLFLIFTTGFNEPFGDFVRYLYENLTLMALFRSPQWFMMPLTISFSILSGIAVNIMLDKFRENYKHILIAQLIFIFIILFIFHPTYMYGDLGTDKLYKRALASDNWYKADHLDDYKIPEDYRAAIEYLYKQKDDSRVIVLPLEISPYFLATNYQRQGSGIDPILAYRAPKGLVFGGNILTDYNSKTMVTMMEKTLYVDRNLDFLQFSKIFNAGYLLFKKDYAPVFSNYRTYWNGEDIYRLLKNNIEHIGEIIIEGESTFLIKLDERYFLPHIYSPDKIDFYDIKGDQNISLLGTIKIFDYLIDDLIIYLKQNAKMAIVSSEYKELASKLNNIDNVKIDYIKINPTKYKIQIFGAKEPFPLVFSETFNPNWKIYGYGRQLFEDTHILVNGYGNYWTINPFQVCNNKCIKNSNGTYDFELIVEFWPQRLFYLGLFVSGLTVFGSFGYLFFDYRRRKKENKNAQIQLD